MTMPWTPNSCPNTLVLRMPCSPPSFRSISKTKTTAEHGMSHQTRRSGTHNNVTRASKSLEELEDADNDQDDAGEDREAPGPAAFPRLGVGTRD